MLFSFLFFHYRGGGAVAGGAPHFRDVVVMFNRFKSKDQYRSLQKKKSNQIKVKGLDLCQSLCVNSQEKPNLNAN